MSAVEAFLRKAICTQGIPEKITIDQSGSNTAAIHHYNKIHKTAIAIRQGKYLNDIVEQDHRAVKRLTRPMLGSKSFWAARCTVAGMEVMHAICKGPLRALGDEGQTPVEQFYALAAQEVMHVEAVRDYVEERYGVASSRLAENASERRNRTMSCYTYPHVQ